MFTTNYNVWKGLTVRQRGSVEKVWRGHKLPAKLRYRFWLYSKVSRQANLNIPHPLCLLQWNKLTFFRRSSITYHKMLFHKRCHLRPCRNPKNVREYDLGHQLQERAYGGQAEESEVYGEDCYEWGGVKRWGKQKGEGFLLLTFSLVTPLSHSIVVLPPSSIYPFYISKSWVGLPGNDYGGSSPLCIRSEFPKKLTPTVLQISALF